MGTKERDLRRIFGQKRDEVTGGRLYSSPNIIRWAEHVARMGEERKVYRVLV
jgi:hypothetical protein